VNRCRTHIERGGLRVARYRAGSKFGACRGARGGEGRRAVTG
jgi:hypothetical protein